MALALALFFSGFEFFRRSRSDSWLKSQ
jgi:hypothetical protein